MKIREASRTELDDVKEVIDNAEEMDTDESTYTIEYFESILADHILLVADAEQNSVVGACFGKYNREEDWADMVGLVVHEDYRNEGIGTKLVETFEQKVKARDISTIDLFADHSRKSFFDQLGYEEGRTYVAFRKHID
jgi:N-acetylglutamate synthase-like GNAT family acetyltransferase